MVRQVNYDGPSFPDTEEESLEAAIEKKYTHELGGEALLGVLDSLTQIRNVASLEPASFEFVADMTQLINDADTFINGGDRSSKAEKSARELVTIQACVLYGQYITASSGEKEVINNAIILNTMARKYIHEEVAK